MMKVRGALPNWFDVFFRDHGHVYTVNSAKKSHNGAERTKPCATQSRRNKCTGILREHTTYMENTKYPLK